jgi:hypothetical protein
VPVRRFARSRPAAPRRSDRSWIRASDRRSSRIADDLLARSGRWSRRRHPPRSGVGACDSTAQTGRRASSDRNPRAGRPPAG